MAATVQYLMEHMIPELEELEKKGYFSRAEIKKIVQKRQDYEYRLKRRAALLEDFYRWAPAGRHLQRVGVLPPYLPVTPKLAKSAHWRMYSHHR